MNGISLADITLANTAVDAVIVVSAAALVYGVEYALSVWLPAFTKRLEDQIVGSNEDLMQLSRPIWSDAEVRSMAEDGVIRGLHGSCTHDVCRSLRARYLDASLAMHAERRHVTRPVRMSEPAPWPHT